MLCSLPYCSQFLWWAIKSPAGYAGWINSFLGIDPYVRVDDSENDTPDVLYYKSDFMQYRWHWNEEAQKYEFQQRWNKDGLYNYIKGVASRVNSEGAVLLKNENNALPLKSGAKVSLFGISQLSSNYITTGNGSGYNDPKTSDTLRNLLEANGLEVNPELYSHYEILGQSHSKNMFNTWPGGDLNYVEYSVNEANASELKDVADSSVGRYGDSAVFVISRLGSENGDTNFDTSTNSDQRKETYVDNNYLDLTEDEISVLELLKGYKQAGTIKNIVLVLNTCTSMQFQTISQYPIDAILWSGTGGTSSYRALADVLTARPTPTVISPILTYTIITALPRRSTRATSHMRSRRAFPERKRMPTAQSTWCIRRAYTSATNITKRATKIW